MSPREFIKASFPDGFKWVFAFNFIPVNFQSISCSKAVTLRKQAPTQEMNTNRVDICLCVVYPDANRLLNPGKHVRGRHQTQMVAGPIITRLAILVLKRCLGWRNALSVKALKKRNHTTTALFPMDVMRRKPRRITNLLCCAANL